ncbi:MAG: hypothetical protein JJU40_10275 [Rhodobacteraceae bacterium]|nr:hypothetical protein [Paracoccaceae bacterium]
MARGLFSDRPPETAAGGPALRLLRSGALVALLVSMIAGASAAQTCPADHIGNLRGLVVSFEDSPTVMIRARPDGLLVEDELDDRNPFDGYRMITDQGVVFMGELPFSEGVLDYEGYVSHGLAEPHPPLPRIMPGLVWAGVFLRIGTDGRGTEVAVAIVAGAEDDAAIGGCSYRRIPVTVYEADGDGSFLGLLDHLPELGVSIIRRSLDTGARVSASQLDQYTVTSIRELDGSDSLPPLE